VLLAALTVTTARSLSACTPDQDLVAYSQLEYHTPMAAFVRWWKGEQASALHVGRATIDDWWRRGDGLLDQPAAKRRYWDVSTDFCSSSPNTGPYWDFKAPCVRHDFAWRNLKKMDARHGGHRFNTSAQRRGATEQFLEDMRSHCADRGILAKAPCLSTANLYYLAVLAVSG
jgi:hypothetical protein